MSIYKFKETVIGIAKDRGVGLYGSHNDLLWQIEKDLENKKISADDVAGKLKENKDFRLNFSGDDFKKIVDAIKY